MQHYMGMLPREKKKQKKKKRPTHGIVFGCVENTQYAQRETGMKPKKGKRTAFVK